MTTWDTIRSARNDKVNVYKHSTDQYMPGTLLVVPGLDGLYAVDTTYPLPIEAPLANFDAFGRSRVSTPYTLFDSKLLFDKQPLLWDELLLNSASSTHSAIHARARLATDATTKGALRQTFQRFNYQPGKSQLIYMTFVAPPAANCRHRIGLVEIGNDSDLTPVNGLFLEILENSFSFNIAKDGDITETKDNTQFNYDKMDGSGPSKLILDFTRPQIMLIDFEWLGVGTAAIAFVVNRRVYYAHFFHHANLSPFDSVYMSTPNLPLSYSTLQTGVGSGLLDCICSTVISEGGLQDLGIMRTINNGKTAVSGASADNVYPLVAIRRKASYGGVTIVPESISGAASTNDSFLLSLIMNPTVSGGSFSFSGLTNSAIEAAIGSGSLTLSAGYPIWSGYASEASRQISAGGRVLPSLGRSIAGVEDILVLAFQPVSSPPVGGLGALNWREQL